VVVLRSSVRQRAALLAEAARDIQHMQKALTPMPRKLQHVVSDMTGVTGLAIIKAILAGERAPRTLARLRDHRGKQDEVAIAHALHGTWRDEHGFALQPASERYEFHHRQIAACDVRIAAHLATFIDRSHGEPLPPRRGQRRRHRNRPACDPREPLHRMTGGDLTRIEGIDATTGVTVLSEIGSDLSKWPSEKQFTSWLGLSPHRRIAGGKVLSRRTRPTTNRAAAALRRAAASRHHSPSALGAYFRRMKSRLETPQAITATAQKLARWIYSMLKHGTAYAAQGLEGYEQQYRARVVKHLARKARELGYEFVKPVETTEAAVPA